MHIINNNKCAAQKISKFTVEFQDVQGCNMVARELELLVRDDYKNIWLTFKSDKAKLLLSSSIDGLIVFLSCIQNNNVMTGEYFSLDSVCDGKIFTDYVSEAQNDAFVDIKQHSVAA